MEFQRVIGVVLQQLKTSHLFLVVMIEAHEHIGRHVFFLTLLRMRQH